MLIRQQIAELRQKRAKLVHDARKLVERREAEGGDLTAEDQAEFDKIMADVEDLRKRVERLEALAEAEAETEGEPEPESDDVEPDEDDEEEEGRSRRRRASSRAIVQRGKMPGQRAGRTSPEFRKAFWRALRGEANGDDIRLLRSEARALSIGTPAKGGYVVPDEFERTLIQRLEDQNVMRRLGTVHTSVSGEKEIPVEGDIGGATWLDEAGTYDDEDVTFDLERIGAHKLGRIIKVSEEFLDDAFFDVEGYVAGVYARTFGRTEEAAMVSGNGVKKPRGVVDRSLKGTEAAANAITPDNILRLYHGLRVPYRSNATWLMNDSTALAVALLKDANDQYIWRAGLQEGEPDTLRGRPVEVSPYMPEIGAGKKSILFGDFSHYWIVDRKGRTFQRLNELYAETGQIGFRCMQRVDGTLTLQEAVVHLLHGAA